MSENIDHLESECRRATADFLALDWGYVKPRVRAAVNEMLSGSKLFTSSMAFLLKETTKLPVQAEPARRLNDLVGVISMLRTRKRQTENLHALPQVSSGSGAG
ncbi:MAG: hypothetical protein ABIZ81_14125 [Opitutaceae bacterium]